MDPPDITIEILKSIRDGVSSTNEELRVTRADLGSKIDQTNERLDQTNGRLELMTERLSRLERRQTAHHVRLFTEVAELHGAVRDLRGAAIDNRRLHDDIADHERRITAIEQREPR